MASQFEQDPRALAAEETEILMQAIDEPKYSKGLSERRERAHTADVEADVERFGEQYRAAREYGVPLPGLTVKGADDPIPVDVGWNLRPFPQPVNRGFRDLGYYAFRDWESLGEAAERWGSGFRFEMLPPDVARRSFGSRLVNFLTARFTHTAQETSAPSPGLMFRVNALTSGLRVHYCPAYWLTGDRVFGAPTTPVDGWISPGRYIFGASGAGSALRFDPAEYDIPPTTEAHLQI